MKNCALVLMITATVVAASAAHAQIKPETSGKPSFYAAEPNPHGSGEYHPNEPRSEDRLMNGADDRPDPRGSQRR